MSSRATTAPRRVDPRRLLRALRLEVVAVSPGTYRVSGGEQPHLVQAPAKGPWLCPCRDAEIRGARCKHVVAVYLFRQLARPVREALRDAVSP